MGKWLVKIGLKIQGLWKKFQLKWNSLVSKLLFNVCDCAEGECNCK